MSNDKRASQRMMRYRVGFQLAAIGALVGGIYWRGIQQLDADGAGAAAAAPRIATENRMWLLQPRPDATTPAAAAPAAGAGTDAEGGETTQLR